MYFCGLKSTLLQFFKNFAIMKKLILSLVIVTVGCTWMTAQNNNDANNSPKQEKLTKEVKKAKKQEGTQLHAKAGSVDFKVATDALSKGEFVFMATRAELGTGKDKSPLDERCNFVSQNGKDGIVQYTFKYSGLSSASEFGGVNCKGMVSGEKYSTDKKGNAHYDYTLAGDGVTLKVNVLVQVGSNHAVVRVEPIVGYGPNMVTLYGELVPFQQELVTPL